MRHTFVDDQIIAAANETHTRLEQDHSGTVAAIELTAFLALALDTRGVKTCPHLTHTPQRLWFALGMPFLACEPCRDSYTNHRQPTCDSCQSSPLAGTHNHRFAASPITVDMHLCSACRTTQLEPDHDLHRLALSTLAAALTDHYDQPQSS